MGGDSKDVTAEPGLAGGQATGFADLTSYMCCFVQKIVILIMEN